METINAGYERIDGWVRDAESPELPGTGPVRGVCEFDGNLIAIRNDEQARHADSLHA